MWVIQTKKEKKKMRKMEVWMFALFAMFALAPLASAEEMVKVFQCPMDGYMVAAKCPHCGMEMEKKEVKAADYQAAIDKQQAKMKGRS